METLHMLHPLDAKVGALASTVRSGFKWRDKVKPGDHVALCTCKSNDPYGPDQEEDHVVRGEGVISEQWVGEFSQVPARLLAYEHEERSREYFGLFNSMQKAYGAEFQADSTVTVLVYERVK